MFDLLSLLRNFWKIDCRLRIMNCSRDSDHIDSSTTRILMSILGMLIISIPWRILTLFSLNSRDPLSYRSRVSDLLLVTAFSRQSIVLWPRLPHLLQTNHCLSFYPSPHIWPSRPFSHAWYHNSGCVSVVCQFLELYCHVYQQRGV